MSKLPIIVVHGGAGNVPEELRESARNGVLNSVKIAWELLIAGKSAVDVVEQAVVELENYSQFNAGTGSVLTAEGKIEMDAMIMDGRKLDIGGVIAVSGIKNPISVSRYILENSAHVLFTGEGAEVYAREAGFELVDPSELITDRTRKRLEKFLEQEGGYGRYISGSDPERRGKYGTVGAVVVDKNGDFAAATSTGGVLGKKTGRVGDTPIPGAGTYADSNMAFSATGVGELIIRSMLGMEMRNQLRIDQDPVIAGERTLEEMQRLIDGQAGLITVTKNGWCAVKTTRDMVYAARSLDMDDFHDFTQD